MTPEQLETLERLEREAWAAPWTARTFEIECPCPNGEDCGDLHSCEEVEAREAYPASHDEPADEGDGQCVVQISVPGLESLARPTSDFIAAMRNAAPSLLRAARDLASLRAAVEALAGRLRSFPEPKPGTYLRGRYDASLALADDLAALLPGGDASATCSCGHSGTSHLPKCACGCGRVR